MIVLLGSLGLFAAVSLFIYTLFDGADDRTTVRDSLRALQGYEVENQRDRELLDPLRDRALKPLLGGLTSLGRRFTPAGYIESTRKKLSSLGRTNGEALDRFLAVRVVTVVAAPIAFLVVLKFAPLTGRNAFLAAGFLALALILGPDSTLNKKVEARRTEIRLKLPDVLDLLTISVEAGLGFEQALDRTIASVPGPLSDEFARMLGEVRAGSSRADAMRALDDRTDVPEVRSFVLAVLQADTFGISIGRMLRGQADEMRVKRRQMAQERAQKAPVKMLIPMVFCVFPALFVVVLGPAVINITQNL